jgi:hypothetical protein
VRRLLGAVALLLLATVACSQGDGGDAAPTGGGATEARFIRVGTTTKEQFTDDQFEQLTEDYAVVLFTKFHMGWDVEGHHEAARRLKAMEPDLIVLPYFSTKYWFRPAEWGTEPDTDWYLRDRNGDIVQKQREGEDQDIGVWLDLSDPDYREWALETMEEWLTAAPYDGMSFDSADPIGDYPEKQVSEWAALLGSEHVREYNEGIEDLLRRTQELVHPGGITLYNGIAPNEIRGPDRDLAQLEVADGALNERFCLDRNGNRVALADDLAIMADHPDEQFYMRTNAPPDLDGEDRERAARFCRAVFLLGWDPGRTFFQFASDYTERQLEDDLPDLQVDFGVPEGPATITGRRGTRSFTRGAVLVNMGKAEVTMASPISGRVVRGGDLHEEVLAGDEVSVPAESAILLSTAGGS